MNTLKLIKIKPNAFIDTSAESAAQFHATIVIKDVITRQNYRSSPEERLKWVHYLVMFVMERYAKYVLILLHVSHPKHYIDWNTL